MDERREWDVVEGVDATKSERVPHYEKKLKIDTTTR